MPALERVQRAMMQAIGGGPEFLPGDLFLGSEERIIAGMKVHANTISHARLIALEETFPRCLELMGQVRFNALSRRYLDRPGIAVPDLCALGEGFPAFLQMEDCAPLVSDLARFEWLWLETYHAADAGVLGLADLVGLGEAELLTVRIARHPSARFGTFGRELHIALEREVPGLAAAAAILLVRPDADVLAIPLDPEMRAVLSACENPLSIGNLLQGGSEPVGKDRLAPDRAMAALIALLGAGALIRANNQEPE